jgi:serine/threonine protein kinase
MTLWHWFTKTEPPTAERKKLYKTVKVLGSGAFGTVKEAIYTPTGDHVAVKSIKKPSDPKKLQKTVQMVHSESSLIKGLTHPHVIGLLDMFETSEKFYMIFEL